MYTNHINGFLLNFDLRPDSKKLTIHSTVSLLWIVTIFLKQTLDGRQQGSQTSWKYALFLLVFVHYSLERERLIKDEPHLSILLLPGHLHIGLLSIPLGHSQLHATAFSQDFCAWWLPDDCKVTARWLPDDFLMTVRWLPDDSLVNVWWMPDNCLMTHVWWETTIRWQWQQNYYIRRLPH